MQFELRSAGPDSTIVGTGKVDNIEIATPPIVLVYDGKNYIYTHSFGETRIYNEEVSFHDLTDEDVVKPDAPKAEGVTH